jgi:hypothetical protein
MEKELVSETIVPNSTLARVIALEDFKANYKFDIYSGTLNGIDKNQSYLRQTVRYTIGF